jgi:hypothetical protein
VSVRQRVHELRSKGARGALSRAVAVERADSLDGAHLWVTFDAPAAGELVVRSATGARILSETAVAGLQTLRLPLGPLADLPDDETHDLELRFVSSDGDRPMSLAASVDTPTRSPVSPDGRWTYAVTDRRGHLVLSRHAEPVTVPVRSIGLVDDSLEVTWDADVPGELAVVDDTGAVDAALPAERADGRARVLLSGDLGLPVGARRYAVVRDGERTTPLSRARNGLARPTASVLMPRVGLSSESNLRLRWARDGRLCVDLEGAAG